MDSKVDLGLRWINHRPFLSDKIVKELVEKRTGAVAPIGGVRMVKEGIVGLYLSDLKNVTNKGLFFVPCYQFDSHPEGGKYYRLHEDEPLVIYRYRDDFIRDINNIVGDLSPSTSVEELTDNIYRFPLEGAKKVYDSATGEIFPWTDGPITEQIITILEGDDIGLEGLTARDIVCSLAGVPDSSKKWVNKIINNRIR